MFTGSLAVDVLLGDVHSLKEKRALVRPVLADLRKHLDVAVAEAGHLDLHRRSLLGVAVVAPDEGHCVEVLATALRRVEDRPELTVLSSRTRFYSLEDD